jgi:hypothetical protein
MLFLPDNQWFCRYQPRCIYALIHTLGHRVVGHLQSTNTATPKHLVQDLHLVLIQRLGHMRRGLLFLDIFAGQLSFAVLTSPSLCDRQEVSPR